VLKVSDHQHDVVNLKPYGQEKKVAENEIDDLSEIEVVEAKIEKQEPKSEDTLPEKYRGKNVADVVKMHQEAEKLASRHAQEVGEVRKLADELLRSQLTKKAEVEKPEVDFFENPQEAMRQAIDNSPKVRQAEEYALNAQRQIALQTLAQKHPDYAQINQDDEFQAWINKSTIRQKLYQSANNYDYEAGDELLSTFKELRTAKQRQVSEVETQARSKALNAAAVDTGGTSEGSKKKYSRTALMNLRLRDPQRYESMSDIIDLAYREGRITP
jgi:hypothetical protein